jgi:glutamate synthase domain-containing protein 2
MTTLEWAVLALAVLGAVTAYDLLQRRHAILRNFPIVGHFRYLLESVGPELRQYIVTDNDEERPFSRDQRRWVYASSKGQNNYFGFGTDNDVESCANYLVVKHSAFPLPDVGHDEVEHRLPAARVLGGFRGRRLAFRPASLVNVSAMSFGSLSANAVEAINKGAALAGCLQNTGEGGIARHHLHCGDLIWQIGTGYFGCRTEQGGLDFERLVEQCARHPVRAVELKLSQGAKPGVGGFLPGRKVTPEIAAIRGIPVGRDCASPPGHSAFASVDEMLDLIERIAQATGLPVGIKSAVGETTFWVELARSMGATDRGPDFITVDGGEGGTGAAPLVFSDHVAFPFKVGFARVRGIFEERGVAGSTLWVGSGKLGFPQDSLLGLALGCDLINVAREAMMAVGCIQAQRCHTGGCPTGVATHRPWLVRGLVPDEKAARLAGYVRSLRKELLRLAHACGEPHPALVPWRQLEILDGRFGAAGLDEVFGCRDDWGLPPEADRVAIRDLMAARSDSAT